MILQYNLCLVCGLRIKSLGIIITSWAINFKRIILQQNTLSTNTKITRFGFFLQNDLRVVITNINCTVS